jgi:hypothetical protein
VTQRKSRYQILTVAAPNSGNLRRRNLEDEETWLANVETNAELNAAQLAAQDSGDPH